MMCYVYLMYFVCVSGRSTLIKVEYVCAYMCVHCAVMRRHLRAGQPNNNSNAYIATYYRGVVLL